MVWTECGHVISYSKENSFKTPVLVINQTSFFFFYQLTFQLIPLNFWLQSCIWSIFPIDQSKVCNLWWLCMRCPQRPMARQMDNEGSGGGARKWYISVDLESISVCSVNLVSVPLAEISEWKVEQHSTPKSHYQIGQVSMFPPNKPPLFFFFLLQRSEARVQRTSGVTLGLSTVRDFIPLYNGVLYKIVSGLFLCMLGQNPIWYLSSMKSPDVYIFFNPELLSPTKGN